MSPYTHDMTYALANEKRSRLLAEADSHRLARTARPQAPGAFARLAKAVGHGWDSITQTFKADRRKQLPAT